MFGQADGAFIGVRDAIWMKSAFEEVIEAPEGLRGEDLVRVLMQRQDQMEVRRMVCAVVVCVPPAPGEEDGVDG